MPRATAPTSRRRREASTQRPARSTTALSSVPKAAWGWLALSRALLVAPARALAFFPVSRSPRMSELFKRPPER
eukprot:14054395-Heterocapsa_arctica.AAC.1